MSPTASASRADNVGILAVELYVPAQYVDLEELERFDGASAGKYTRGIGHARTALCTDREDVQSLLLTVAGNLMRRHGVDAADIGRLDVGTETLLDKAKASKTVLMRLFGEHTDIEGVDSKNACYGGTAALLNAVNWVESSAWDGRLALVVAGDVALHPKLGLRAVSGSGAVAMLVGPDAPLVLDHGVRASHMADAYDFYKPDPSTEFALLDSELSVRCYLKALDRCYTRYCAKADERALAGGPRMSLERLDAVLFHTPFHRLVQKAVARMALHDVARLPPTDEAESRYPGLAEYSHLAATLQADDGHPLENRDVERAALRASEAAFAAKAERGTRVARLVGNTYTASVYAALASHLAHSAAAELAGTRIALFSYGSGLAATMFSLRVADDASPGSPLHRLCARLADHVFPMLEARVKVPPEQLAEAVDAVDTIARQAPFTPTSSTASLRPGTFFLEHVDEQFRRTYGVVPA